MMCVSVFSKIYGSGKDNGGIWILTGSLNEECGSVSMFKKYEDSEVHYGGKYSKANNGIESIKGEWQISAECKGPFELTTDKKFVRSPITKLD